MLVGKTISSHPSSRLLHCFCNHTFILGQDCHKVEILSYIFSYHSLGDRVYHHITQFLVNITFSLKANLKTKQDRCSG